MQGLGARPGRRPGSPCWVIKGNDLRSSRVGTRLWKLSELSHRGQVLARRGVGGVMFLFAASVDRVGNTAIFAIVSLLLHEYERLYICYVFFHVLCHLQYSVYKALLLLLNISLGIFYIIINELVFVISSLECLLRVYGNTGDFRDLVLDPLQPR